MLLFFKAETTIYWGRFVQAKIAGYWYNSEEEMLGRRASPLG
jgi:hypothetical protein